MLTDQNKVPKFEIDLAPSLEGESFAQYQANSAPMTAVTLRPDQNAADFWFHATVYQLPHAVLFRSAAMEHDMHRGPQEIGYGNDPIFLLVQLSGRIQGTCAGMPVTIEPGDIAFYDYTRQFTSHVDDFTMMALLIARDRVPPLFHATAAHGAVLRADTGAARLVRSSVQALYDSVEDLSLAVADAAAEAVFVTAGGALAESRLGDAPSVGTNSAGLQHALSFIGAHLADADLGAEKLQAELRISRSALYRLFDPLGGVNAFILRKRLDRSTRLILNSVTVAPSFYDLATACGFRSESYMTRTFRNRFGITPRAFHGMVRRKDYAGLSEQAQRAGFTSLQAWLDDARDS